MEKEVSIKNLPLYGQSAYLYGVSFDSDKLFGFTIDEADKIRDKILEEAKKNKESIKFKEFNTTNDYTKEYIRVYSPSDLYYQLLKRFALPTQLEKISEESKIYLESLFPIFCNNINCYKTGIVVLFLDGYYSRARKFKKTSKYLLTIQSSSDVITNSSSELFCVATENNENELSDLLEKYAEQHDQGHCSGVGGDIDIYSIDRTQVIKALFGANNPNVNCEDINKRFLDIYREVYGLPKEGTVLVIDIDNGFYNTMDFIEKELKGVRV